MSDAFMCVCVCVCLCTSTCVCVTFIWRSSSLNDALPSGPTTTFPRSPTCCTIQGDQVKKSTRVQHEVTFTSLQSLLQSPVILLLIDSQSVSWTESSTFFCYLSLSNLFKKVRGSWSGRITAPDVGCRSYFTCSESVFTLSESSGPPWGFP